MGVNTPVTNPNFLKAIQLMGQDSTKESQFFDELFKATFLCPGQIDKGNLTKSRDGRTTLGKDTKISLSLLEAKSGKSYLIAFTDWDELRKWENIQRQQTFLFSIEDYRTIVLGNQHYDGVVINPFGVNLVFDRERLESIHSNQNSIKQDEPVMIGEPRIYPQDMIDKLKSYFQATKLVDKAYLLWMARGNETSYLMVLDSDLTPQELFPMIGEVCEPYLNGQMLDMVSWNSSFGKNVVKNQRPFYQV